MDVNDEILVSVVVLTYNHENYIRKALNSILRQKRNFRIEILVGDDCSKDNTPKIIQWYQKKYPDLFRVKLRNKNVGATRNSYDLYVRARGKYIAVLEGDDYWCDRNKLKKQVEFLESNRQYPACCSDFIYIDENNRRMEALRESKLKNELYCGRKIYTLNDMNHSLLPSHASTLLFRNLFKEGVDGKIIYQAHDIIGDFTVALLILSNGNIYKIDQVMSCYRHINKDGSSWTAKTNVNPFHFYELFLYHTKLENYASEKLNLKLNLKLFKSISFGRMMMGVIDRPTPARVRCVMEMLQVTKNKGHYLWIAAKCFYLRKAPEVIRGVYADGVDGQILPELQMSWNQFWKNEKGKMIVLYGAGGGCREFSDQYFGKIPIECVIDSDPNRHGTYIEGYKICSDSFFSSVKSEDVAVIITAGIRMNEIAQKLYDMGIWHVYSYVVMESKRLRYFLLNI